MLTKTTEAGILALTYLALRDAPDPIAPRAIAAELELSATYLAKVTTALVKADLLRSRRGAKGGVMLSRRPREIRLREVVEALQGRIVGRHCSDTEGTREICAFHEAMQQVHEATLRILDRWTLQDLAARPAGKRASGGHSTCLMACLGG